MPGIRPGANRVSRPARASPALPRPGWVEHDPEEIWENVQQVVSVAMEKADLSISDVCALGIANQRETTVLWESRTGAGAQRDQLAGHPYRQAVSGPGARVRPGSVSAQDRTAGRDLLLGSQGELAAGPHSGAARTGRGRRDPVRHGRFMADLEPLWPSCHRRHQRKPDAANEHRDARLGPGTARSDGHPGGDPARDPGLLGGLRRGGSSTCRSPRRLGARRPVRGAGGPDLL